MNTRSIHNSLLALTVIVAACGSPYDPPSLIEPDKLRVLGVSAEPPAITLAAETTMAALAVGVADDVTLCYAWAYCPFTWTANGAYSCVDPDLLVPLGTDPTSRVGIADVAASLANAQNVFAKLGLQLPAATGGSPDGCKSSSSGGGPFDLSGLPDSYILFQIAEAGLFGGTCPDARNALALPCADRAKCIQGVKRLALVTSPVAACTAFDAATDKNCASVDPCDIKPVCGCDGRTYDSNCERVAAKVSKRADGACPNQNPALTGVALYWPLSGGALEAMGALQPDSHTYAVDAPHAGAIAWPEEVTITLHPGDAIELLPLWPAGAEEYIGKSADPAAPPVYEAPAVLVVYDGWQLGQGPLLRRVSRKRADRAVARRRRQAAHPEHLARHA